MKISKNRLVSHFLNRDCRKLLQQRFKNPIDLAAKLKIPNKDGSLVSFEIWEEQRTILNQMVEGKDLLILKARQIGSSTILAFFIFWKWLLSDDPIQLVAGYHKLEMSKKKLKLIRNWYEQLPDTIKNLRPLSIARDDALEFADTKAAIYANGFTQKGSLRSISCQIFALSELTLADRPDELLTACLAAVNDGQIIIETTASHYEDAMDREIKKNLAGITNYQFLFFPWSEHKEYQRQTKLTIKDLSEEEKILHKSGMNPITGLPDPNLPGLSLNQIEWRRETIGQYPTEREFKKEYPLSYPEAYSQAANYFIDEKFLRDITVHQHQLNRINYYREPNPQNRYLIGVDPAMGLHRDYSAVVVWDTRAKEVAASFYSNETEPKLVIEHAGLLSNKYGYNSHNGRAQVILESNGQGNVCVAYANELRLPIWYENNKPFETNLKTKPIIVNLIRQYLTEHRMKSIDTFILNDLRTAQFDDRLIVPAKATSHFDGGMALGMALYLESKIPQQLTSRERFFSHVKQGS